MVGMVARNKRRYGGYIVHVGIVLMFLGFAGEGFGRDEQALLKPGEQVQVDRYVLRLDAIRATEDSQKQMVTGHVTVLDAGGRELGKMYPAKWFYRTPPDEPTTEVAIWRSLAEDLYIVMAGFELGEQIGQRRDARQRAGQLDLDRLRPAGARHRHRAAARARVRLRRRRASASRPPPRRCS